MLVGTSRYELDVLGTKLGAVKVTRLVAIYSHVGNAYYFKLLEIKYLNVPTRELGTRFSVPFQYQNFKIEFYSNQYENSPSEYPPNFKMVSHTMVLGKNKTSRRIELGRYSKLYFNKKGILAKISMLGRKHAIFSEYDFQLPFNISSIG